jgi:hypothetical protein
MGLIEDFMTDSLFFYKNDLQNELKNMIIKKLGFRE